MQVPKSEAVPQPCEIRVECRTGAERCFKLTGCDLSNTPESPPNVRSYEQPQVIHHFNTADRRFGSREWMGKIFFVFFGQHNYRVVSFRDRLFQFRLFKRLSRT